MRSVTFFLFNLTTFEAWPAIFGAILVLHVCEAFTIAALDTNSNYYVCAFIFCWFSKVNIWVYLNSKGLQGILFVNILYPFARLNGKSWIILPKKSKRWRQKLPRDFRKEKSSASQEMNGPVCMAGNTSISPLKPWMVKWLTLVRWLYNFIIEILFLNITFIIFPLFTIETER